MTSIQQRLRGEATTLRTKSMPLNHLIPLLSQSAEHIDKAEAEISSLKSQRDELLDASKNLLDAVETQGEYREGSWTDVWVKKARAAIAKAEGRTE